MSCEKDRHIDRCKAMNIWGLNTDLHMLVLTIHLIICCQCRILLSWWLWGKNAKSWPMVLISVKRQEIGSLIETFVEKEKIACSYWEIFSLILNYRWWTYIHRRAETLEDGTTLSICWLLGRHLKGWHMAIPRPVMMIHLWMMSCLVTN